MRLVIDKTWDGRAAAPTEVASLRLSDEGGLLRIEVRAPYCGDPAPPGPAGPRWGLWEHEVVELFILGDGERYTEIELGPHGHHLVLQLGPRRSVRARELPLDYRAQIRGDRWTGLALLDRDLLPGGPHRGNAYAIHGPPGERRHLAWTPVPGPEPDFHRLEHFRPLRYSQA